MPKEPFAPFESEALRIQFWIEQDKQRRIPPLFYHENLQEFHRTHTCNPLKVPPIFSQIEHLPMQGYLLSKKKKAEAHLWHFETQTETPLCNVNQKYVPSLDQEGTLLASRVVPYHFKEHFYVSKKLKALAKQIKTSPCKRSVVSLQTKGQYVHEEWLLPPERPERLFQIDRITKYLS